MTVPPTPATVNTVPASPQGQAVSAVRNLNGQDWRAMMMFACKWLEANHELVNSLNVFPVPDGDTGTNMLLTMQDACNEMNEKADGTVGSVFHAVAHGALMGARGNSGVILSQILRGMARIVDTKPVINARELAEALQAGSETAYKGVQKPVEGTILTVIRLGAEAAQQAAASNNDIPFVLNHIVRAATQAVEDTPSLLPILAQAGVVDSGGMGLCYILEGWLKHLAGEPILAAATETRVAFVGKTDAVEGEYNYDVQFIIRGNQLNVDSTRQNINKMGDSVLVVGDDQTIKVHVHTDEPGTPINFGAGLGTLTQIIVENMHEQYREFVHGEGPGDAPATIQRQPKPYLAHTTIEMPPDIARVSVVAVALGAGLQDVFRSLGASAVTGGQTMNPSTEELFRAIESTLSDEVIVLSNNSNVVLTAQQAGDLTYKQVHVLPTHTVPQGLAALLAFSPQSDGETNMVRMIEAMQGVQTGEVTTSVREVSFDGIQVKPGDIIGLLDDRVASKSDSPEDVVVSLLQQMSAETAEVLTIYSGESVNKARAEALVEEVRQVYYDQEVELLDGGQPHYFYIISVE